MIRDVFERHVLGADPFRIEALWRNVYGRGYTGRPDASLMGVLQRDRDGALGHRRQGGRQARLRPPRRQGPRAAAQLHLPLSGRAGLARPFRQPGLFHSARRGRARAQIPDAGLHRREIRSGRPLLRPSIRASRASSGSNSARPSARPCARRSGHAATSCSARTGSSPSRARCASPAASSPTSRCGSRSRPRRRRPRRWRRSPRSAACRSRPARG